MFDLVVSASSIFGGLWEGGAGAIAAENQTLEWLAGLAGFPAGAGGCFVSGGSAANLSALVTARHHAREAADDAAGPLALRHHRRDPRLRPRRGAGDGRRRRARAARRARPDDRRRAARRRSTTTPAPTGCSPSSPTSARRTPAPSTSSTPSPTSAPSATCGCTSTPPTAGAALCAPSTAELRRGFERADSFGIDPHKWLFAPYDCAALVYREPALASAAHAQHGTYLDMVSRDEWNPSDFAFHLSRRARGLPLWFSLATYGTDAYTRRRRVDARRRPRLRRRGRPARRLHAAARAAAVGRAVHRRRLGRGPLRGVEHVARQGRRRPRRADVVAGRGLLPGLPRQPADDVGDADASCSTTWRLRG